MNALVSVENTEEQNAGLEQAAAVRGKTSYATPLEQIKQGFYFVVLHSHAAFRTAMVSSLLNEKALETLETSDVGEAMNFDLLAFSDAVVINKLREWLKFRPGNGTDKPFEIVFDEVFYNIDTEIVKKIISYMPKDALKGMPLDKFISAIEKFGVSNVISSQLESTLETLKEKYIDPLSDVVEFIIKVERLTYNDQTKTDSLIFNFSIRVDGSVYKELVQADKFEPYLLYLWLMNTLTVQGDRRGVKIVSPRFVASHNKAMQKFGLVRPKVNENGFAMHGSGVPMLIPPNLNLVDKFLDAANSSINDDGSFDSEMLTQQGFRNVVIYTDWVNDIMAYISNTGRLETINLGQVHPLDKATEYMFLTTPIQSPAMRRFINTLSSSINALDANNAVKYTDNLEAKQVLQTTPPDKIFMDVVLRTAGENDQDVRLMHLAGYAIDRDFGDDPRRAANIRALRALFRLLYETAKTDADAIVIADSYKSLGLLFRLIGTEYLIQTFAKSTEDRVAKLKESFDAERKKADIDFNKRSFDIPNIVLGKGFQGLLPHQGRILSSTEKTPSTMMLPVQTGGGKTILSAATAIKAIENLNTIPMITTKGNLVRGTITELNAITEGKINAIPLRPATIRQLRRQTDIKTFARFLEWYKALPPNTILVNAYTDFASRRKLFDDLDTVDGFGDAPVHTTQYLLIIKLLGIRVFIGDESHMIKNPESARSRNSYTAFSQGDVRALMSGTMVSNTVIDLVGQARAASPYIFGDDANQFAENYGVSTGLITDEDASIIKTRLRSTTAYHEATREDWSFMLPQRADDILFAQLTPKQQEFYDVLMQEAYLIMLEEEKNKKKKKKASDDSESDDDDEDEDEEEDDEDESDDEDGALIAKAKTHLQKVESFLVAPDMNEQYMTFRGVPGKSNYTSSPDGEDLVSPKVRLADKLIEEHYNKNKNDLAQNKIIVFGWNRAASQHFMKYSRFASKALHYTAGDLEVARRFENDPSAWLMVADEGSVREGFNWQMTSLILRQQSVWAPGDHEQTLARMYRPDPRGKYNRERVRHLWLMVQLSNGQPSLDGVKMARLVSKTISNARLTYEGRIEWRRVSATFDDMKLLKMNLDLIFNAKREDIEPYFGNWEEFIRWENENNRDAKRRLAAKLEAQTGETLVDSKGNILDINKFIKAAMYEVTSSKDLKGSKRVWVPWTAGAIPADPMNWGFKVMGNQNVPVGTAVYTQFGPGIIEGILTKGVKVRLYDGRVIGMKKNVIMLVNESRYPDLVKIVKDPTKWREHAVDVWGVKGNAKRPENPVEEEEVIQNLDDEAEQTDLLDFDIVATIINGWPALLVQDDIPQLKTVSDWYRVDPFLTVSFRTWAHLDKFIDLLDSKVFIPADVIDQIDTEIEMFKTGKALTLTKQIPQASVRQFFREQHKKNGKTKDGKSIVKPYLFAIEREIKLAFDIDSHDPRVINWLMRAKEKVPGVKSVKKNGAVWINTFNKASEAFDDVKALQSLTKVDLKKLRADLVDVRDEIADLKKSRSKPSV